MSPNVPVWKLNTVQMLALGCLGIALGALVKKKLPLLGRLCIPTSIVGGMIFALGALFLHDRYLNFEPDPTLRDLMMVAFMSTIGFNARLELIRRGGVQVLWMLGLASGGAVLQNLLGIGLAKLLRVNPLLGILSGSVALTGGPATAAAFGSTFEEMGVHGATELALSSATFGIAVAGLVAGYIGNRLVRRHALQAQPVPVSHNSVVQNNESNIDTRGAEAQDATQFGPLLRTVLIMGVAMGLGNLISLGLSRLHLTLPSYIGAMIAAAVIRNLDDRLQLVRISQSRLNDCAVVSLYLFIVTAVLGLRLWELAHLVLPILVILACQVVLCWMMCIVVFYLMGQSYESAIMSSGFCGFMLGITANAIASMDDLVEKYGPAPQAFLVVPVVGAFLIDFVNSQIILVMARFIGYR
jgi:ESS family glutamate:Na+ symporter